MVQIRTYFWRCERDHFAWTCMRVQTLHHMQKNWHHIRRSRKLDWPNMHALTLWIFELFDYPGYPHGDNDYTLIYIMETASYGQRIHMTFYHFSLVSRSHRSVISKVCQVYSKIMKLFCMRGHWRNLNTGHMILWWKICCIINDIFHHQNQKLYIYLS